MKSMQLESPVKTFFKPKSAKQLYERVNFNNEIVVTNLSKKFFNLEKQLKIAFFQRDEIIHSLVLAMLSGKTMGRGSNIMFIGPPGTAKSAIVDYLANCIENDVAKECNIMFRTLYHQFIKPAEVFGPEDIDELLKNKRIVRQMENFLANAIFVFYDEIYKANDAIRNILLTAINEGTFQLDGKWYDLPCLCHFAASNEIGKEPAFKDRFLQWFYVPYIQGREDRLKYLKAKKLPVPEICLKLSEIYLAQLEVSKVEISDITYKTLLDIVDDIGSPEEISGKKGKGISVSDRRIREILPLLQAEAFLNNRKETEPEDCSMLVPCLWNNPSEIKQVQKIVQKHSNSQLLDILEKVDVATATFQNISSGAEKASDEIKEILQDLKLIVPLKRNETEYKKSISIVDAIYKGSVQIAIKEKESGQVRR